MKIFFLDTNIFLQCNDLEFLPWEDISCGDDNVLLLIPRPVQEEIDHLKHDGSSRRAKRARRVTALFRELILTSDQKKTLRKSGPTVVVTFSPLVNSEKKMNPLLDLSRNDDQIINEALIYMEDHSVEEVALLTHDTNPLLTSKRCGLQGIMIPDNWLLPPEPDSRDKKISQLESRVRELEKLYPIIEVMFRDAKGNKIGALDMEVPRFRSISDDEFMNLMEEVTRRYPMATDFDEQDSQRSWRINGKALNTTTEVYKPPSKEVIKQYQEVKYPAWVKDVEKFIRDFPARLEWSNRVVEISLMLSNAGSVPAESVIVEFRLEGDLFFKPPRDEKEKTEKNEVRFPSPPKAPRGVWRLDQGVGASALDLFNAGLSAKAMAMGVISERVQPDIAFPRHKDTRDRNAFYWKPSRPYSDTKVWNFECDEFRHKDAAEIFEMKIFIPFNKDVQKGALICRVSARNLPSPWEGILPIKVNYSEKDAVARLRQLIGNESFTI